MVDVGNVRCCKGLNQPVCGKIKAKHTVPAQGLLGSDRVLCVTHLPSWGFASSRGMDTMLEMCHFRAKLMKASVRCG